VIERIPLSPISRHALQDAQRQAEQHVHHVLSLAAESEGRHPRDGWTFDPHALEWVRTRPDAAAGSGGAREDVPPTATPMAVP
jgi:hypothetical protein